MSDKDIPTPLNPDTILHVVHTLNDARYDVDNGTNAKFPMQLVADMRDSLKCEANKITTTVDVLRRMIENCPVCRNARFCFCGYCAEARELLNHQVPRRD